MKMIKVWIDEELYDIIKEATDNKSISVSEYVRDILSKNSYVDITLDFADVYRYVETIEDLKQKSILFFLLSFAPEEFTSRKPLLLDIP